MGDDINTKNSNN